MGFWDTILSSVPGVRAFSPRVEYIGGNEDIVDYYGTTDLVEHASAASLWRSQPHLRTVVSFLARNVAQLGLHTFERVDETDRRRDRSSLAARALAFPDSSMTTYDLIYALVGDMMLYDRAYWYVGPSSATRSGVMIRRFPPTWVTVTPSDPFTVASYLVSMDGKRSVSIPARSILDFTGYSPTNSTKGSPTVETLRDTLREQVEAARYRGQVWKRGGRVSSVLQRPTGAPQWSDTAREAFREDWYAKFTGRGPKAGGTPILEDGMTLQRIDFNAQEQQFVEAAKLSLVTVASAFHVNPTMIGQNDGANYSNVREFRKMLYGDTLGPLLAQIEARVNTFLLPMLGVDEDRYYVEFNIAEKLQGSFEEQAAAMSSAVGAPWMLRSEARGRMNLPAIAEADALVVPLNVLIGGQASALDSGTQNLKPKALPVLTKAAATDPQREQAQRVVKAFFSRQERVVRTALGSKSAQDWWDDERWDSELSDDLMRLALLVSSEVGQKTAQALGFSAEDYDVDRTLAFLRAVTDRASSSINATTKAQIEEALAADDVPAALDSTFTTGREQRSGAVAASLLASAAGFGSVESAKQVAGDVATKTWVTGPKSRPSHAAMNGETVPLSEDFSNGLAWPGDGGDADEVAGCNCSLQINIP